MDLSDKASLKALFQKTGTVDAVVCAAVNWRHGKPLDQVTDEDFTFSIHGKLMGIVSLVRTALGNITDNGSITLTSGVFATEPWPATSPTAMANAAFEGFVRAAAQDLGGRHSHQCGQSNLCHRDRLNDGDVQRRHLVGW